MNRILVPTDFSECAGFAEKAAISIAGKTESEIVFLHALSIGMDWNTLSKMEEEKYPEIKEKIASAERLLNERVDTAKAAGVKASKVVVFLDAYKNLSEAIAGQPHDFLVLGSHGKGSFKNLFVGSNTGRLLRTVKTPVFVLQDELPDPLVFKNIVFASGLEPDTHAALDLLLRFSKKMGAEKLHFIEVTTPNNFSPTSLVLKEMKNFIARHECPAIELVNYNHYNVEAGIIEYAQEEKADLIAIANHGRSDISGLFIESIPENLVKFSSLPVLSIRV